MAQAAASVLPNRKAFSDYIARIFMKYRKMDTAADDDEGVDVCVRQSAAKGARELLPFQKLVRDYLLIETPYRGLLVYHGLGSGKTCSSIGVAESLISEKKVFVMLPASLQNNFRQEIRKCGDPIYMLDNYWETRVIHSEADKIPALALKIPDELLRTEGRYYVTVPGKEPNFNTLPLDIRRGIDKQISAMIDARYTFINYNGLNGDSVKVLIPEDDPKTSTVFNNSVVIVDEAHNLMSRVISGSKIGQRIYDAIYYAKECKVVLLSGTPVINRPNEIAYMMNLLRGPSERILIPVRELPTWDEVGMTSYFRKMPEVDTVEFNSVKRIIQVVRNPPHFKSVYGPSGNRIAVQYDKDLDSKTHKDWVDSIRRSFSATFPGGVLGAREYVSVEYLECLPTNFQEFVNTFVDGLDVKNALLFQKRIQGLVSYYKGSDERMLPKRIEDNNMLEKIEMSDEQFNKYLEQRWTEVQSEGKKGASGSGSLNEDFSYYRVLSRLACNYAVPNDLKSLMTEDQPLDEKKEVDKSAILAKLRENPDKYLRPAGLATYSPKMAKVLANILEEGDHNQFVYSNYRKLEGLGVLSAILEANGFQQYKLEKVDGKYRESSALDPAKLAFAFYTGEEEQTEKEIMRLIFNEDFKGLQANYAEHSQTIRESITARGAKKMLTILMATSSGAEGINLKNVRRLHIVEPHWNPARHDQVMGRGIRLCSHATRQTLVDGVVTDNVVPIEERTIRISFYLSVFTKAQAASTTAFNVVPIRRADMRAKRYDGSNEDSFLSSDEFLYEVSYEKGRITEGISRLIKQAAVDCEIHRKLHSREQPVLQCMRFDSTVKGEDLAYNPNMKSDERDDTYLRNFIKRGRRLQRIKIKDIVFLVDPDSKEVFDEPAFGDAQRLLKIGTMLADRIQFFTTEAN